METTLERKRRMNEERKRRGQNIAVSAAKEKKLDSKEDICTRHIHKGKLKLNDYELEKLSMIV